MSQIIEFIHPYSLSLDIGEAYNQAIAKCEDWICLNDHDTLKPPGFVERLQEVLKTADKRTIYGCMTNRVGWNHPAIVPGMFMEDSITKHLEKANELWNTYGTQTEPTEVIPGYCMCFHRSLADEFLPLPKRTYTFDRIISQGRNTVLMKGIYIIHLYRWGLENPSPVKDHLVKPGLLLRQPLFNK